MSSTNRGSARNADDYYKSPAWCVDALLARIGQLAGKRILEPSAGDGAIVRRLLAAGATRELILAIEPNDARAFAVGQLVPTVLDRFEAWAHGAQRFDIVIMNQPFCAAQAHVELAISLLAPGGLCCALERLAFGASRKRAGFRARYPYDKLELASRPSFTAEALAAMTEADLLAARVGDETIEDVRRRLRGTDSADYAWFCFGQWPTTARIWPGTPCGGRFKVLEDNADRAGESAALML